MKDVIKFLIQSYFGMQTISFLKLLRDGRVEFYEGMKNKKKRKAVNFLRKLKKKGFSRYKIFFNNYGYIIKSLT